MAGYQTFQYAPPASPAAAAAPASTSPGGFNINPGAQGGQGPYGAVPGAIGLPNPAGDLGAVYPNLSGSTAKTSSDILSELSGQLSPETLNNIGNQAASFGVSSGMPLSGLSRSKQLESLGLTTEQLQHQGIGDFLSATPVVSKTQTVSPELQTEIASRNAIFGAAPNPGSAALTQEDLYQQQLNQLRQPTAISQPNSRLGGATQAGLAKPGQGNPPPVSAAQPGPGTVGPFGPAGGITPPIGPTGFQSPANPMSLIPTGNAYGDVGNPNGLPPNPNATAPNPMSQTGDFGLGATIGGAFGGSPGASLGGAAAGLIGDFASIYSPPTNDTYMGDYGPSTDQSGGISGQ